MACDVREEDQVQAAVEAAAQADGGLRICVCCAGTGCAQKIAGSRGPHALEPFAVIIAINLIGTFNVLRFAASRHAGQRAARGPASAACASTPRRSPPTTGQIGQVAYSASKGGVVGMTLPAARDLASAGIRVCTIAPGLFDTPLLAALPLEARESLGKSSRSPRAWASRPSTRRSRPHRREPDAQRRGHPARRRAADGAALMESAI